jgi:hypothetical protein
MLYTKFSNVNIIRNAAKFFIHTYKVSALEQSHFTPTVLRLGSEADHSFLASESKSRKCQFIVTLTCKFLE